LGIKYDYFIEVVCEVIDFYKNFDILIRVKSCIAGLKLWVIDIDWIYGEGLLVEGWLMDLLMVVIG